MVIYLLIYEFIYKLVNKLHPFVLLPISFPNLLDSSALFRLWNYFINQL